LSIVDALPVQHLNVKIFAREPLIIDLGEAIPIFHSWIQRNALEGMLIDVADYRHVPAGPGVMLIGHDANYSLDNRADRLGLLYNRKTPLEGSTREKLLQAFQAAAAACERLQVDFQRKVRFNGGDCEVFINDRLIAPNTDETWARLQPELTHFCDGLYGAGNYSLEKTGEPRELFRVTLKTPQPVEVKGLLRDRQAP